MGEDMGMRISEEDVTKARDFAGRMSVYLDRALESRHLAAQLMTPREVRVQFEDTRGQRDGLDARFVDPTLKHDLAKAFQRHEHECLRKAALQLHYLRVTFLPLLVDANLLAEGK